jgi:hypothetical protein
VEGVTLFICSRVPACAVDDLEGESITGLTTEPSTFDGLE